ncbi:MAG: site-specific DNA-methyltransferase, partial [Bacillota bacterium]
LYPEICANNAQREEWVRLFAIDEIKSDLVEPGYSVPLTVEFLKANPFLALDTKYFTESFYANLLSSLEDLDEQLDGILIKSENYQSLHLLQNLVHNRIRFIYIDPPFYL